MPPTFDTERTELVPNQTWPLILVSPGRGNASADFWVTNFPNMKTLNVDANAMIFGLIGKSSPLAAPTGENSWNTSDACCWPPGEPPSAPNDIGDLADSPEPGWIATVIDSICLAPVGHGQWPCDPKRIYLAGHSAGGAVAYAYACKHPSQVAGVFLLSGLARRPDVPDATGACAAGHFHVAHWHATSDPILPYDNSTHVVVPQMVAEIPSVEVDRAPINSFVTQAKGQNGCAGSLSTTTASWLDFDSAVGGSETDLLEVGGCPSDGSVQIWKGQADSNHNPTITTAGVAQIGAWITAHPKP